MRLREDHLNNFYHDVKNAHTPWKNANMTSLAFLVFLMVSLVFHRASIAASRPTIPATDESDDLYSKVNMAEVSIWGVYRGF